MQSITIVSCDGHRGRSGTEPPHLVHNGLVGYRASKRLAGRVRNVANQLAQIATGFEASHDGPVLLAEQVASGRYVIDALNEICLVNGRETKLGMVDVLSTWIHGELERLKGEPGWLTQAIVAVDYTLIPSDEFMDAHDGYWTSQAFVAHLSAMVSVVTYESTTSASFQNFQAVIGKLADPVRPMPAADHPIASKGAPFEIKRKAGRPSGRTTDSSPTEA